MCLKVDVQSTTASSNPSASIKPRRAFQLSPPCQQEDHFSVPQLTWHLAPRIIKYLHYAHRPVSLIRNQAMVLWQGGGLHSTVRTGCATTWTGFGPSRPGHCLKPCRTRESCFLRPCLIRPFSSTRPVHILRHGLEGDCKSSWTMSHIRSCSMY